MGGPRAIWYAAWFSADKIEALLAGYTGHPDSASILWNFERVPAAFRVIVMGRLDLRTRARWNQSAEDALMEDMDINDYRRLSAMEGITLRPYDRRLTVGHAAEIVVGGFEWGLIGLEVIAGGIIGIITGIISVLWDILVLAWDIVVASYNLFWSFMYLLSGGTVGSAEWLATKDFFRGFGELFSDPGKILWQAWDDLALASATIEGPFEYGRRAEFWTRRVVNIVVNLLLVAAAGYGAVKGIAAAVTETAELAKTVGTLRAIGQVARNSLRAAGRVIALTGEQARLLLQALRHPLRLLTDIRRAVGLVLVMVHDEGIWRFVRKRTGEWLAGEREWWQARREQWRQRGTAHQTREADLSAEANQIQKDLEQNRAPEQAEGQIQGIQEDANQLKKEVDELNREVTGEPEPARAQPEGEPQKQPQAQPSTPPVPPGQLSPTVSMGRMLMRVWDDRVELLEQARRIEAANPARVAQGLEPMNPWQPIYLIYAEASEPNVLTRAPREFLDDLSRLAVDRPLGARSTTQTGFGAEGEVRFIPEVVAEAGTAGFDEARIGRTFFRYERTGADLRAVTERVYLNINADRATEVMEFVVRQIVDNPAEFPGVEMAKVSGPGAVSRRPETIVIYCRDQAAVERVLKRIEQFQAANPDDFMVTSPPMTSPVAPGVSVASEPLPMAGGGSFGSVRARAMYEALVESVNANETRGEFYARVRRQLRARGVDPDAPHRNLPSAGGTPEGGTR
jgi:hypothetical protein